MTRDAQGPTIIIEQSDILEQQSVILHPRQLRAICEQFDIVPPDWSAEKTIRTLQRRLMALDERIQDLFSHMAKHSDHAHADLSFEMTRLGILADLSDEWVGELHDVAPNLPVQRHTAEVSSKPNRRPASPEQTELPLLDE